MLKSFAKSRLPAGRLMDGAFAIARYLQRHRHMPRLREPRLFNEHLMRLKLDGTLTDPLVQYVTDKEHLKEYVTGVVGAEYVVQTYDVVRSVDEVANLNIRQYPCVVKPTHMSGRIVICLDNDSELDKELLIRWLRTSYYKQSREANYRYLLPKVIIEEFFSADGFTTPPDYKVFCFGGIPMVIEVDRGRFQRHTRNFYDTEWQRLNLAIKYPTRIEDDSRPSALDTMLNVAHELSRPFATMRVDMYTIDRGVKVGELTSCHGSAGEKVWPVEAEQWLGELFSSEAIGVARRLRQEFYNTPPSHPGSADEYR